MSNITTLSMDFLKKLKKNNNREWFQKNKLHYEQAREEFENFIEALIEGESLKKVPRDFPADHPYGHRLKKKSFLAIHKVSDSNILNPDFLKYCLKGYKNLKPFDDFLNLSA